VSSGWVTVPHMPTLDADHVVEVSGLQKRYGDRAAVDGIEFHVVRGEIVAMLGPNGAGKSTTIEILEGFRGRDGGEVSVLGVDPAKSHRRWRSRLGIVLQDRSLNDEVTSVEMLSHFARFYERPRPVDEVLDLVGLGEQRSQRISKLSGGQQRRLEVGLGVIGRPELLFLDEPTTGFDPEARRHFWDLIKMLADDGTTILLTTHYLEEAEALADRAVILVGGKIVAEGPPATIGGRSTHGVKVRWRDDDGPHEQLTEAPTAFVRELAGHFGGEIPDLAISRPSLEDVYLDLIGDRR
jgi:ABC-2 type transport system ATP-binding protein